jgi:hypothetical protein
MQLELRPMTGGEYEAFLQRNLSRYAQELLLTKKTEVEQHALAEAQVALRALVFTVETHFDFSDSGSLQVRPPSCPVYGGCARRGT